VIQRSSRLVTRRWSASQARLWTGAALHQEQAPAIQLDRRLPLRYPGPETLYLRKHSFYRIRGHPRLFV